MRFAQNYSEVVDWLLTGDPSIAYQTARDLLEEERPDLKAKIPHVGWGKAYLDARNADGSWGTGYLTPQWACTHYALLDLVNMECPPETDNIAELVEAIALRQVAQDGGLGIAIDEKKSDTCITAMFLVIASHFGIAEKHLTTFIDFLISMQISDGGFNCQVNRSGCRSSSLHSTLSVLEALQKLEEAGYAYKRQERTLMAEQARGVILRHKFFRSKRTNEIIHPRFLKLPYPTRWHYNYLRSLDYFRKARQPYHPAMQDALRRLQAACRPDGRWPRMAKLPGTLIVEMEPQRGLGRWNTLIALRVLKHFGATQTQSSRAVDCVD